MDRGTKGIRLLIVAVICWHVNAKNRIFNNSSHLVHICLDFILCGIVFWTGLLAGEDRQHFSKDSLDTRKEKEAASESEDGIEG